MRILVGWDNPDEVDLLGTYLAVEDAESPGVVRICTTAAEVLQAARETNWDAVLVATTFPSPEQAFAVFTEHCGYHVFPLHDAKIVRVHETQLHPVPAR